MNHGPDDKSPDGLGPDGIGFGSDGLGLGSDELDLRRILHSAVEDIEPRDGTLDHLRRAVPARRARKRHAALGLTAAALLLATAVPAVVHVSRSGDSDPNTSMAGQATQAQDGTSQGKNPDGGSHASGGSEPGTPGHGRTGEKEDPKDRTSPGGTGSTAGVSPSSSAGADVPACTAAQLGSATGSAGAPDSAGVVYGTFRVTNVSTTGCGVSGAGAVTVLAQGAADAAKVGAVRHMAGDAAAGLPDPSQEAGVLVLAPGASYEEKFAFVPSETCPTIGDGGDSGGTDPGTPSPDPTPTDDTSTGGGTDTGTTTGVSPQLLRTEGTADGSVVVTHTPQAGGPAASATVSGACAGTVYWTGVLPAA